MGKMHFSDTAQKSVEKGTRTKIKLTSRLLEIAPAIPTPLLADLGRGVII
jgi:hypothetical protein